MIILEATKNVRRACLATTPETHATVWPGVSFIFSTLSNPAIFTISLPPPAAMSILSSSKSQSTISAGPTSMDCPIFNFGSRITWHTETKLPLCDAAFSDVLSAPTPAATGAAATISILTRSRVICKTDEFAWNQTLKYPLSVFNKNSQKTQNSCERMFLFCERMRRGMITKPKI